MTSVKRRNVEVHYDKKQQKIYAISMKELNKQKVLDFLTQHIEGVYPYQIKEEADITPEPTRQTIHNYLRELVSEKKIRKDKRSGRYFMSDLEPGIIHRFSQSMNNACHTILDKVYNPSSPDLRKHPDPSFIELSKAISGNAVSEEYCRTKFDANSSNERYFFEFVNRIGAYIVFIFIASIQMSLKELRTNADKQNKRANLDQKIATLHSELFRKSIDVGSIFEDFINLLRFINSPSFEIPIETFRRVYPGIYKGLQNEWHNEVKDHSNWLEAREQAGVYCDHKWEPLSIIMLPEKYYFCRRCGELIDEKYMNAMSKRKVR